MKALVIAPYRELEEEKVLEGTSILAEICVEALKREAFAVTLLEGPAAKRKNLPKDHFELVLFCGHGEERSLIGSDGRAIFDDDNVDYFIDSIVVSVACKSAAWLGLSATSRGAKGYLGFTDLVCLPLSSETHAYRSDFLRTFSVFVLALLEGYTLYQSWLEFKSACLAYASEYDEQKYDIYSDPMRGFMLYNANACHYEGKPSASLGSEALVVKWSE